MKVGWSAWLHVLLWESGVNSDFSESHWSNDCFLSLTEGCATRHFSLYFGLLLHDWLLDRLTQYGSTRFLEMYPPPSLRAKPWPNPNPGVGASLQTWINPTIRPSEASESPDWSISNSLSPSLTNPGTPEEHRKSARVQWQAEIWPRRLSKRCAKPEDVGNAQRQTARGAADEVHPRQRREQPAVQGTRRRVDFVSGRSRVVEKTGGKIHRVSCAVSGENSLDRSLVPNGVTSEVNLVVVGSPHQFVFFKMQRLYRGVPRHRVCSLPFWV